jgi:hypothetical protein
VQAGSGPLASGTRTVIVEADCPAGEMLCSNGTCGSDGMCAGDLNNALMPTTAGGGSAWIDGSEQSQLEAPVNSPPRITLRTASGFGASVSIKQGTPYPMCATGQVRLHGLGAQAHPPRNCQRLFTCPTSRSQDAKLHSPTSPAPRV